MAKTDIAIRDAIDSFVEQLRTLIQQAALDSVQAALSGRGTSLRGNVRPSRVIERSSSVQFEKGAKRTSEELEVLVKKLHSHIAKNPGQRIEQIGKALGVTTKELILPVKKLVEEKRLSKKGQKRATTYDAK